MSSSLALIDLYMGPSVFAFKLIIPCYLMLNIYLIAIYLYLATVLLIVCRSKLEIKKKNTFKPIHCIICVIDRDSLPRLFWVGNWCLWPLCQHFFSRPATRSGITR